MKAGNDEENLDHHKNKYDKTVITWGRSRCCQLKILTCCNKVGCAAICYGETGNTETLSRLHELNKGLDMCHNEIWKESNYRFFYFINSGGK